MGGLKMNKINVAIADDNQRTVEMMTELLEQESDIEVIASADDGEEAFVSSRKNNRMLYYWISLCRNSMELVY